MADLFPKPFPNANLSRANVSPAIQKARQVYRIRFLPDSFLQPFLALLAMELWTSSPIRLPLLFDNSREVVLDVYNPIRPLNTLYQSLGRLFWARRCT
jgi:hypothetical protein